MNKVNRHSKKMRGSSAPLRIAAGGVGAALVLMISAEGAAGQSSSLYVQQEGQSQQTQQLDHRQLSRQMRDREPQMQQSQPQPQDGAIGDRSIQPQEPGLDRPQLQLERREKGRVVHTQLQAMSFTAVPLPEPRHFAEHDLVTVIIREQTQASSSQSLTTEQESEVAAELQAMPRLQLRELLNFQLRAGDEEDLPEFGLSQENEWEGEGDYSRRDAMTTRLTARVIDVKPNGTLALEARTHIRTDRETQTIVVTGYCRADDITADNSILSTQMFDLRVEREHGGELRNATEKGVLTRILDGVLNF